MLGLSGNIICEFVKKLKHVLKAKIMLFILFLYKRKFQPITWFEKTNFYTILQ